MDSSKTVSAAGIDQYDFDDSEDGVDDFEDNHHYQDRLITDDILILKNHWLAKARNYNPVIRLPIYKDHDGRHYYGHADLLPVQDLNN